MIYFDHGATSFPKPTGMVEAMEDCMLRYCGNPGRSGHRMSMKMGEKIYEARKQVASLLGIKDASRLIFTKNTTEGLNLALRGILQNGDHVVTTAMEHNSVLRPLHQLEKKGITHTIVPADRKGKIKVNDIERAITDKTRLIVMTGASNVTGAIMPVENVCRMAKEKGILTLIDGAQYVGSLPVRAEQLGIDLLAFPGHKGLLGPPGTGGLYVSETAIRNLELTPLLYGGTGTVSKSDLQPLDFPEGYEAGTVNGPGLIGLGYSAAMLNRIGMDTIAFHERELCSLFEEYLRNMDFVTVYGPKPEEKIGITLFNLCGISSEEVTERLSREYGIAVRGGFHCAPLAHRAIGTFDDGAVRLSAGPFNTRKEIRYAADAVYRIGKRKESPF